MIGVDVEAVYFYLNELYQTYYQLQFYWKNSYKTIKDMINEIFVSSESYFIDRMLSERSGSWFNFRWNVKIGLLVIYKFKPQEITPWLYKITCLNRELWNSKYFAYIT